MKLTTGILGCALATGLVTFASSNAHAGGIGIDGDLYAPLKVKAKITYEDGNKFKTMSFNNKDILALADLDFKGAILTYNIDDGDVYVVAKEDGDYTEIADLTYYGNNDTFVEIDLDEYLSTGKEKNNGYEESGQGSFWLGVWQYDYYTVGEEGEFADYYEVDLYGNYSDKYSYKENSSDYSEKYSLKAKSLAGEAYYWDDYDEEYYDYEPAAGSVSANGSAKFDFIE